MRRLHDDPPADPRAVAKRARIRLIQVGVYALASLGVLVWSFTEPLFGTMKVLVGLMVFYLAARSFTFYMKYRMERPRPRIWDGPSRFTYEDLPAPGPADPPRSDEKKDG